MATVKQDDGAATGAPEVHEDARFAKAWRVWLAALAHDPEAAWAAALTYRSLDVDGRNAWIDALEIDAPSVGAPAIALYAPLLGVEDDVERRARIRAALEKHGASAPTTMAPTNVLRGLRGDTLGSRVVVLVHPLYLDFVEILTCVLDEDGGFGEVHHQPLCRASEGPTDGDRVPGRPGISVELEAVPVELVIEELAHAIVAHRRTHGNTPPALLRFVDLFTPRPEYVDRNKLGGA
ncbi:MAG: hypothetical protein IPJ34_07740 [Myxococcales bacterium]|nr:hypothetical protein [Myxococcales bacterium]